MNTIYLGAVALFVIFSSSVRSDEVKLLLDASCKVSCDFYEESNSPGYPSYKQTKIIYVDFSGKTRKDIEALAGNSCKKIISPDAIPAKKECSFFPSAGNSCR